MDYDKLAQLKGKLELAKEEYREAEKQYAEIYYKWTTSKDADRIAKQTQRLYAVIKTRNQKKQAVEQALKEYATEKLVQVIMDNICNPFIEEVCDL